MLGESYREETPGTDRADNWIDLRGKGLVTSGLMLYQSNEIRAQNVLGMQWNPREDVFSFKVMLNFSKRGSTRGRSYLCQGDIPDKMPRFTRRIVLSQLNVFLTRRVC